MPVVLPQEVESEWLAADPDTREEPPDGPLMGGERSETLLSALDADIPGGVQEDVVGNLFVFPLAVLLAVVRRMPIARLSSPAATSAIRYSWSS